MTMVNPTNRFDPFDEVEDTEEYFEWLEMFLMVQGMPRDKKVAHVISDIGSKVYVVLKNLLVATSCAERQHTSEHQEDTFRTLQT